jgi:hypothetical protein
MHYLGILATCLISYSIWAVILSDSLFHRVWSLSLCSLLWLALILYALPLSTYTIPLSLLSLINLLLCIALSPLQIFFHSADCIYEEQERLSIHSPSNTCLTNNNGSQDTLFVESVPCVLILRLELKCVVSIIFVHGLASNPKTAWKSRSTTKLSWVSDFLPQENLNCRIIAFNHNTAWEANALSKSLSDHADNFVRAFRSVRKTEEVRDNGPRNLVKTGV